MYFCILPKSRVFQSLLTFFKITMQPSGASVSFYHKYKAYNPDKKNLCHKIATNTTPKQLVCMYVKGGGGG